MMNNEHRYQWNDCAKTRNKLKPFVYDGVKDFVAKEKKSYFNSEFMLLHLVTWFGCHHH